MSTLTTDSRIDKSAPDVAPMPEWLHALPSDGSYTTAGNLIPGDFMFEYYETGSFWLPVLKVVVAGGNAAVTYGLYGGATVTPSADRTLRVLRRADAIALHALRGQQSDGLAS